MVWADRIAGEIRERFAEKIARGTPLVIRDEKTLSGRVHVGSLRGIVIHGAIAQVLEESGIASVFRFELNDADPMDEIPRTLDRSTYERYMGQPLFTVPVLETPFDAAALPSNEERQAGRSATKREAAQPHSRKASNYPMIFGDELKDVVAPLGLPIEWYTLRPHYEHGGFNDVIREALEHAADIRTIYREVSGSKKPDDWYPLQVICERCGKIGTTQVTGWNGKEVTYACKPDLVAWARGCGHKGILSPFDGRAKLPWKVEWPAKWKVFGVDIEGAGKDHGAAGGSRDIGRRIVEEVFHYPEPYNIHYEFLNLGGKKMSASKGIGVSAKEIADMLPPTLLKLLMIRKLPNQPIDFDPGGTTIPALFDEYDRLADHHFKRHPNPDADFARTFAMTQIGFPKEKPQDLWQMRFTTLAFVLQMPHLKLEEEAAKIKTFDACRGAPEGRPVEITQAELHALVERARYVRQWLSSHAPEEYRFAILPSPPPLEIDAEQRSALTKVCDVLADKKLPWEGAAIHEAIHAVKAECGIAPRKLFEPLYMMFLGRKNGPQVGWFLSTMEKERVCSQIEKALT